MDAKSLRYDSAGKPRHSVTVLDSPIFIAELLGVRKGGIEKVT